MSSNLLSKISQIIGKAAPALPSGPHVFQLSQQTVEINLKYQKRKTLTLEIQNGQTVIKAPFGTPAHWIHTFVDQKQTWILAKLAKQEAQIRNQMHYRDGDKFLFLGSWHRLSIHAGNKFQMVLNAFEKELCIVVPNTVKDEQAYVRNKLKGFYRQQLEQYLTDQVPNLIRRTGLEPKSVRTKFYKRRWGCCYQSGEIIINPLIMAAPPEYIDCVLIHELCHIKHMNHSKQFWQLNALYCDHCDATKTWLEQHQQAIFLP